MIYIDGKINYVSNRPICQYQISNYNPYFSITYVMSPVPNRMDTKNIKRNNTAISLTRSK
jgi:hypothetical protein